MAFFPVSGYEYIKTDKDMVKANNKFAPQYIGIGEGENPYIRLTIKNLKDCEEEFIKWSELLLSPIVELAQEADHANA